jgi:hypothetical protein
MGLLIATLFAAVIGLTSSMAAFTPPLKLRELLNYLGHEICLTMFGRYKGTRECVFERHLSL